MKLYLSYVKILSKAQMQYRISFWLLSFGQFFIPFSVFAALYFLFERFGSITGWTFYEVANIFTDGGREISQYPLNIYKKWVTRFFTFIIPFGCVSYLPLLYILDRVNGNELLYMLAPLYGMLFIIPCLFVWRFGVRHYRSTGS